MNRRGFFKRALGAVALAATTVYFPKSLDPVVLPKAKRPMRTLWTKEAKKDLNAYHSLELEGELTRILSEEIRREVDKELIMDLRRLI